MSGLAGTTATGMSSETILFEASWQQDGQQRHERLVARVAPHPADAPVFPSYDLEKQARVIELAGDMSSVPVPPIFWSEPSSDVLGTPFFVMGRIDGVPPPDVMPYNFGDSWLYDASPENQRILQDATVDVIAKLHSIDGAQDVFGFLAFDELGDSRLRQHVAHARAWYDYAVEAVGRSAVIERAFRWLDDHWPTKEGEPVLCWGDSRIGNVLYEDFTPVAVLDWEMAALGPRELDVAWLIYGHEVFEHLAQNYGMGGMPDFMREADVTAAYERLTGHRLADLHFYRTYAAVQYAIVFLRVGWRSVHFGERDMPGDPDEFLHNRGQLEAMTSS